MPYVIDDKGIDPKFLAIHKKKLWRFKENKWTYWQGSIAPVNERNWKVEQPIVFFNIFLYIMTSFVGKSKNFEMFLQVYGH